MKNQDLKIENWINFGQNLIKAIQLWTKSYSQKLKIKKHEDSSEN